MDTVKKAERAVWAEHGEKGREGVQYPVQCGMNTVKKTERV